MVSIVLHNRSVLTAIIAGSGFSYLWTLRVPPPLHDSCVLSPSTPTSSVLTVPNRAPCFAAPVVPFRHCRLGASEQLQGTPSSTPLRLWRLQCCLVAATGLFAECSALKYGPPHV